MTVIFVWTASEGEHGFKTPLNNLALGFLRKTGVPMGPVAHTALCNVHEEIKFQDHPGIF